MKTKTCIHCGEIIPNDASYCPECGGWQQSNTLPPPTPAMDTYKKTYKAKDVTTTKPAPQESLKKIYPRPKEQDQTELERMAYHDELTGLFNRQKLTQIQKSLKQEDTCVILVIDINNLKHTNDTFGHAAGDQLILNMANVLKRIAPETSYRLGGDEFLLLLKDEEFDTGKALKNQIILALDDLRKDKDNGFVPTAAIGIAQKRSMESYERAFKRADDAMYKDKKAIKAKNKKIEKNEKNNNYILDTRESRNERQTVNKNYIDTKVSYEEKKKLYIKITIQKVCETGVLFGLIGLLYFVRSQIGL